MSDTTYNEDYFERGISTGVSCYTNYRWIPEMTIPMAMAYIDYLGIKEGEHVLDYGCAKGFTVKALRLLHREAWGCDISEYAVNSADNDTRKFLKIMNNGSDIPFEVENNFDYIVSKDVFEHIPKDDLLKILKKMRHIGKKLFVIVPIGKNDRYVIPAYELDKTHIIREDFDWWKNIFTEAGWYVEEATDYVPHIKENWKNFEGGNGFFLLT